MKAMIRFLITLLLMLLMTTSVLAEASFSEHMAEVIENLNAGNEPGSAYVVTKGDWVVGYTATGEKAWISKTETNSDYFQTGVEDAHGDVVWYPKNEKREKHGVPSSVKRHFPAKSRNLR